MPTIKTDTGLTLYAKPTLSTEVTWTTDVISGTEQTFGGNGTGVYSFPLISPAGYLVYQQTGGSPAFGDEAIAEFPPKEGVETIDVVPGNEFKFAFDGTTGSAVLLVASGLSGGQTAASTLTSLGNGQVLATWTAAATTSATAGLVARVTVGGVTVGQGLVATTGNVNALGTQGLGVNFTLRDDSAAVVSNSIINVLNGAGVAQDIWGRTDANGLLTLRMPAGDYQFQVSSRSGFLNHSPVAVTVASEGQAVALTVTRIAAPATADAPLCAVTLNVLNAASRGVNRTRVSVKLKEEGSFTASALVVPQTLSKFTDTSGMVTFNLIRNTEFTKGTGEYEIAVHTPDQIIRFDYKAPDAGSDTITLSA